ncbi:hypothetical protein CHS0354_007540 [Potamilus streckersoni]|uniref:Copine C-terminal domain-containing protein n=1 Tax=Potamilus streckersoni TaxID=2493646 RepID=A0AAE0VGG1_9BIVA|nr:hypothetical protein CHS0354_007540 [Potamilus streckersoni]
MCYTDDSLETCTRAAVIVTIGETLQDLDDDGIIPVYGFGDEDTKDKSVFPLKSEGKCKGFNEVLNVYNERTPNVQLSGPTNFVPLIEKAVKIVRKTRKLASRSLCATYRIKYKDDNEIKADLPAESITV